MPELNERVSNERLVWPLGGYAPGSYSCKCLGCDEQFVGDKRATQCLDCAIIWANKTISAQQRRASVVSPEMVRAELGRMNEAGCLTVYEIADDRGLTVDEYVDLFMAVTATLSVSHETGDGEGCPDIAERICHKEQIGIWADEIITALSMDDFLKEDWTFDDTVEAGAAIASQLRSIIGSALTHPEYNVSEQIGRLIYERDVWRSKSNMHQNAAGRRTDALEYPFSNAVRAALATGEKSR